MAVYDCRFRSTIMGRDMPFMLIVPQEDSLYTIPGLKSKVVFCLHGLGGDYRECYSKLPLEVAANTFNLTFVLPQAERSFYNNGLYDYEDYLTKDLVPYLEAHFKLPPKEDWAIMGISMGGYGALAMLSRYPELFHRACCMSPALDFDQIVELSKIDDYRVGKEKTLIDYFIKHRDYADPAYYSFEEGQEVLIMAGTEDVLQKGCLAYEKVLEEKGVPFASIYDKGGHDWFFWNKHLMEACKFLQGLPIKEEK